MPVFASCFLAKSDKTAKRPDEIRNQMWWVHGYQHWTNVQFKRRLRVTRDTLRFIFDAVIGDIRKETTKFKEPTSPECQLGLTLHRLAHGCSYTTVCDLFGVAPSTACTIFNHVVKVIVHTLCDVYVTLLGSKEEWKAELTSFLEDWEFPCVGA